MTPAYEEAPVNAVAAAQGAHEPNTNQGEQSMSIIADTSQNRASLDAYIAEMTQLYAEHARPIISADDPRVEHLLALDGANSRFVQRALDDGEMGEPLGRLYFNQVFDQKPAIPHVLEDTFGWSANARASMSQDEIMIAFESREISVGEYTGTIHQSATIFTDVCTDRDGTLYSAGDVIVDPKPSLIIPGVIEVDATAAELGDIAGVLLGAISALMFGAQEAGK